MKKWILIITSIIIFVLAGIVIKINYDLDTITESFNSEHSLIEDNLKIINESISPDRKYKFYEYQFDNGGLGYSRIFWSVVNNDKDTNDLKEGIIPNGYKIVGWENNNKLILKKWQPYYETKTNFILDHQIEFKGIRIKIIE